MTPTLARSLPKRNLGRNEVANVFKSHDGREIKYLPLGYLFVDHKMGQRKLNKANLAAISTGYDAKAPGVLVVSKRGEKSFAVMDGQHRLHVMREKGESEAICLIHKGLTLQQEASLFEKLNRSKPLRGIELFTARYEAGDVLATNIVDTLRKHGFELAIFHDKKRCPKTINCGGTLYKQAQEHGMNAFNKAFAIIAECFKSPNGGIQRAALKGDFLPGLFEFLKNTETKLSVIKNTFKTISADQLLAEAHKDNACHGKRCGFKLPSTLAEVIRRKILTARIYAA